MTDPSDPGLDQSSKGQDFKEKELQQKIRLRDLGPYSLQALHELVSVVHNQVNVADINQPKQLTSTSYSELNLENENQKILMTTLFRIEDDPIAKILWTLESHILQDVLLAMAVSFYKAL